MLKLVWLKLGSTSPLASSIFESGSSLAAPSFLRSYSNWFSTFLSISSISSSTFDEWSLSALSASSPYSEPYLSASSELYLCSSSFDLSSFLEPSDSISSSLIEIFCVSTFSLFFGYLSELRFRLAGWKLSAFSSC